MRAVHQMTGFRADYIMDKLSCTLGNMYHALWWDDYNARRMMSAMGEIPQIYVLSLENEAQEENRV